MASQDLTVESLPHTRKELFFDILKTRFKLIVVLGLFLTLSCLPTLIVFFLKDFSLQGLYSSYDWANITEEQIVEYSNLYREQNNFWNLFLLPCFVIIGLYLSGFMRVIRQLNYSKGIHLGDDFKIGLKQNWLSFTLMSVVVFALYYLCSSISNMAVDNILIKYLPIGVIIIIFLPLFLNMMSLVVTYTLKFASLVKTGLILGLRNILWYLIFIISFFLPMALFLIPYYFITYFVFLVFTVLYYPILLLANYLFNYASFDKYINKDNQPDYYRKGLY